MIGTTLGHYEILEKLGEGGMGVVYKARDLRLDRLVAIKVLQESRLRDEDRLRRFSQEARTASALNHPNIITIHDIAGEAGKQYIVMEYVRGKTLDQLIPRKGMRLAEVLKIGIQVADAVAAAAAAGVVHRDLKPGNIMVADTGLVKVLDFGLAKLTDRVGVPSEETATIAMDADAAHTQDGAILGTISYMSPEQAEGKPLDGRSDIFSFGAVAYEMITGQRAFSGGTKMSTLSAVMRDDPKPASALAADTPRDLEKIVTRCLRKDPDRRFQHMSDVRVALLELKEESESGALTPAATPRRRAGRIWIFAAAGIVMLIAGGLLWLRTRQAGPPLAELEPRLVPFMSSGSQSSPTFSPDGNQIAFAWTGDPPVQSHIYVKMIGTESPLRLTSGDFTDVAPAWAPDGKSIAFLRRRDLSETSATIFQVPPLGGPERRIAEIGIRRSAHLSWTRDSKWLAVSAREAEGKYRVYLVSAETGEKRPLTAGETAIEVSPELSPDNRWLAFTRVGETTSELFVLALDAGLRPVGQPREIQAPSGFKGSVAWTSDSKEIVFTNSATGPLAGRLLRAPVAGNVPARSLPFVDTCAFPAIHGNRMAFTRLFSDSNIWQFEVAGTGGHASAPKPLISSTRLDMVNPHGISPDGRRIAFESNRSGPYGIWLANSDGSSPTYLLGGDATVGSPAWSPDGRWIAFDTRKDGNVEIYVVSAESGAPRRLTEHPKDDMVPAWSHDGKWIYFVSNRTGRFEIFKMPAAGGEAVQFTRDGGWAPQESPDGKYLFYSRDRRFNTPLLKIPVEGGAEIKVLDSVGERQWRVVKEGIWFFAGSSRSGPAALRFLNSATGKISDVGVAQNRTMNGLDVMPDGRTIVYSQLDHTGTELMLVENFR